MILGFELGADDYITKPFSPRELIARIHAVARRTGIEESPRQVFVKAGDLEIDRDRFEVRVKAWFELLAVLASSPGRVFGRDELLAHRRCPPRPLRAKFVATKLPMPAIETVRGVGYRFREQNGNGSTG